MASTLVIDDTAYETELPENALKRGRAAADPEIIKAFIPGTIVAVRTKVGERVRAGDTLLLLDAMKMHNEVCSTVNGVVRELQVTTGDKVEKGQLLVRLRKD
jgi:biotin carboxyl carrier protein